jgi:MFS family permease
MVVMNVVYAGSAYPFGKWSDRMAARDLLAASLVVLVIADLVLAAADRPAVLAGGVVLWGLHMGMSQGLLARMVADVAPLDLRGTAFGAFNFASGLALLVASGLAGFLWEAHGPQATFLAGAGFAAATWLLLTRF